MLSTVSARLVKKVVLSSSITQLFIQPVQKLRYQAGQYIEICLSDQIQRPFSIANAPNPDGVIELHVVTATDFARALLNELEAETAVLNIVGPYGEVTLHKNEHYPIIMVAYIAGFVPFKAMIEQALSEVYPLPMHLYWVGNKQEDIYMPNLPLQWEKQSAAFSYTPVLHQPVIDKLIDNYSDLSCYQYYLCGDLETVCLLRDQLVSYGARQDLIYSDSFDYMAKK